MKAPAAAHMKIIVDELPEKAEDCLFAYKSYVSKFDAMRLFCKLDKGCRMLCKGVDKCEKLSLLNTVVARKE